MTCSNLGKRMCCPAEMNFFFPTEKAFMSYDVFQACQQQQQQFPEIVPYFLENFKDCAQ